LKVALAVICATLPRERRRRERQAENNKQREGSAHSRGLLGHVRIVPRQQATTQERRRNGWVVAALPERMQPYPKDWRPDLRASLSIFLAAFTSRSSVVPHVGQSQPRTSSGRSSRPATVWNRAEAELLTAELDAALTGEKK
jgi:hypothetical protein